MVFFQYLTGQCAGNLKIRILVVPQPLGLILSDWEYILPMLILGAGLSHCGVSIWTGYAPKTPEKDIPSRLLDEEKYAKEASGSGGHLSAAVSLKGANSKGGEWWKSLFSHMNRDSIVLLMCTTTNLI
ncbi:uncharacterized protein LOC106755443 isoform X2 [Vigna radiata var. radiata]|uniref:Uncharacterized protein LOC106755443 isoform X2 n=1 Tax=Vigna radiata var. radiata TaxID=3916 RepID=A0A1S3TH42_VIGRR|nr:uncharacterized protein LOC106755443 isoform X2 [Vigna radiata var. radiata]